MEFNSNYYGYIGYKLAIKEIVIRNVIHDNMNCIVVVNNFISIKKFCEEMILCISSLDIKSDFTTTGFVILFENLSSIEFVKNDKVISLDNDKYDILFIDNYTEKFDFDYSKNNLLINNSFKIIKSF